MSSFSWSSNRAFAASTPKNTQEFCHQSRTSVSYKLCASSVLSVIDEEFYSLVISQSNEAGIDKSHFIGCLLTCYTGHHHSQVVSHMQISLYTLSNCIINTMYVVIFCVIMFNNNWISFFCHSIMFIDPEPEQERSDQYERSVTLCVFLFYSQ